MLYFCLWRGNIQLYCRIVLFVNPVNNLPWHTPSLRRNTHLLIPVRRNWTTHSLITLLVTVWRFLLWIVSTSRILFISLTHVSSYPAGSTCPLPSSTTSMTPFPDSQSLICRMSRPYVWPLTCGQTDKCVASWWLLDTLWRTGHYHQWCWLVHAFVDVTQLTTYYSSTRILWLSIRYHTKYLTLWQIVRQTSSKHSRSTYLASTVVLMMNTITRIRTIYLMKRQILLPLTIYRIT